MFDHSARRAAPALVFLTAATFALPSEISWPGVFSFSGNLWLAAAPLEAGSGIASTAADDSPSPPTQVKPGSHRSTAEADGAATFAAATSPAPTLDFKRPTAIEVDAGTRRSLHTELEIGAAASESADNRDLKYQSTEKNLRFAPMGGSGATGFDGPALETKVPSQVLPQAIVATNSAPGKRQATQERSQIDLRHSSPIPKRFSAAVAADSPRPNGSSQANGSSEPNGSSQPKSFNRSFGEQHDTAAGQPQADRQTEHQKNPERFAKQLWQYLLANNYKHWSPGQGRSADFYPGDFDPSQFKSNEVSLSPPTAAAASDLHGALLKMYVNRKAASQPESPPVGSIIVLENYRQDKSLQSISVMYRSRGFNPAANDWYWVNYNPDGSVADAARSNRAEQTVTSTTTVGQWKADKLMGRSDACIRCHQSAGDGDLAFFNNRLPTDLQALRPSQVAGLTGSPTAGAIESLAAESLATESLATESLAAEPPGVETTGVKPTAAESRLRGPLNESTPAAVTMEGLPVRQASYNEAVTDDLDCP